MSEKPPVTLTRLGVTEFPRVATKAGRNDMRTARKVLRTVQAIEELAQFCQSVSPLDVGLGLRGDFAFTPLELVSLISAWHDEMISILMSKQGMHQLLQCDEDSTFIRGGTL